LSKIPNKRIVCPVLAFRLLTNQKLEEACSEGRCCYLCPKADEGCEKGMGCSRKILKGYPEKCSTYPFTFGEAKRLFLSYRMFNNPAPNNNLDILGFVQLVRKYFREKRKNA